MDFRKIKYDQKQVLLAWDTRHGEDTHRHELESKDTPAPEFVAALDALRPLVLELLEMPEEYGARDFRVQSVTISYPENPEVAWGATITSLKQLEECSAPLVLNTPYLPSEPTSEEGPCLPTAILDALDTLRAEAQRYIEGHREQRDLFEGENGDGGVVEISFQGRTVKTTGAGLRRAAQRAREMETVDA